MWDSFCYSDTICNILVAVLLLERTMDRSIEIVQDQTDPGICPCCGNTYDLNDDTDALAAFDDFTTVRKPEPGIHEIARHICGGLVRMVWA